MILPRLYAIVDDQVARQRGWTMSGLARAYLNAGVRLVQLRAKTLGARELLEVAEAVSMDAARDGAQIIVNDRADVARMVPGTGVHVGQDDLPPALVRAIVGAEAVVGFSTHSAEQAGAALLEPITYLAVGPVFGTRTKDTGYDAIGLDLVRHAVAAGGELARSSGRPPMPVVAIGGITLDNCASVIEAGATSVAVISGLFEDGDPTERARQFLARLA